MKKIDKTVIVETKFIGAWVLIFSSLMQAVFLIIGKWDYTVLLGNGLSAAASIVSFLVLGITIVKAVSSGDTDYAKKLMKASSAVRTFFLFLVILLGVLLPVFNTWATVIPITFPRLGLLIRSFMVKRMNQNEAEGSENGGEVDKLD